MKANSVEKALGKMLNSWQIQKGVAKCYPHLNPFTMKKCNCGTPSKTGLCKDCQKEFNKVGAYPESADDVEEFWISESFTPSQKKQVHQNLSVLIDGI